MTAPAPPTARMPAATAAAQPRRNRGRAKAGAGDRSRARAVISLSETGRAPASISARTCLASSLATIDPQLDPEAGEAPLDVGLHGRLPDPRQFRNLAQRIAIAVDEDNGHPLAM